MRFIPVSNLGKFKWFVLNVINIQRLAATVIFVSARKCRDTVLDV